MTNLRTRRMTKRTMKHARHASPKPGAGAAMPRWFVYPFFGLHMLMFGLSGFFMAYAAD
jgi:hypothetical protein